MTRPTQEPERDWHGWAARSIPGMSMPILHIGPLPGRKSICLYTIEKGVLDVRAYFRSEQDASEALRVLDRLVLGTTDEHPGG